jgi:DNA polymerase-3 subunit chi
MTRIDFYVLSSSDPQTRRVTACRLIEKAYRQGHSIFLRTGSADETRLFDDLLWTFRQGSFVPHELADSTAGEAPVLIGQELPVSGPRDVLVNMDSTLPLDFASFDRVAELVDQEESVRQAGRQRYKHYQMQGHELQTHQLDRTEG